MTQGAPKGNRFWEARSKHGRDKIFASPDILWEASCEYFKHIEDTPLWESKVAQFQGEPVDMILPKMRPMTIRGLARFLHISHDTWYDYRKQKDFSDICSEIEGIIYDQKFAGAAADLLNPSIISRDLGLKDRTEIGGDPNNPIVTRDITETMDPIEAARIYKELTSGG